MNLFKKYLTLLLSLFLASMGIALAIKSGVGLAAFDAFNQTVADTTNMQVGTIVMFVQIFFVFLQIVVLRKEASWKILLQIPFVVLLGQFINLFVYYIFGNLDLTNYFLRLILFILSQFWTSFFISIMLVLDLIAMPIENLSLILSKRIPFTLGQIRLAIDVLLIVSSLAITFIFSVPLSIREGTLVSALIFGPMLGVFMPALIPYFENWKLIDYGIKTKED